MEAEKAVLVLVRVTVNLRCPLQVMHALSVEATSLEEIWRMMMMMMMMIKRMRVNVEEETPNVVLTLVVQK
jgi:hypothetical protein